MATNNYTFDYAIHPGEFLKRALSNIGMKQSELAEKTGISKTVINEIIKGKRSINTDFAIAIEPIFDMPASYWLGLQNDFDIATAKAGNTVLDEDADITIGNNKAIDIAYWFIDKAAAEAQEESDYITPLKLQKLLFFAQAISLKRNNKTVFREQIKCWNYGPVVEEVWKQFGNYHKNPIKEGKEVSFDKTTEKVLEETYKKYGIYTAGYLVKLTHNEKVWADAEKNQVLSPIVIRNTYTGIIL